MTISTMVIGQGLFVQKKTMVKVLFPEPKGRKEERKKATHV